MERMQCNAASIVSCIARASVQSNRAPPAFWLRTGAPGPGPGGILARFCRLCPAILGRSRSTGHGWELVLQTGIGRDPSCNRARMPSHGSSRLPFIMEAGGQPGGSRSHAHALGRRRSSPPAPFPPSRLLRRLCTASTVSRTQTRTSPCSSTHRARLRPRALLYPSSTQPECARYGTARVRSATVVKAPVTSEAMDADAPATPFRKPASLPPLFAVRARSRVADLGAGAGPGAGAAFPGPPDTPPRRSPVTVPFLWEEAPGKPKAPPPPTFAAPAAANVPEGGGGGDEQQDSGHADQARPVPLKLPPRLQQVSSFAAADTPLSPKTMLQGPYYGCADGSRRPPRWSRSGGGDKQKDSGHADQARPVPLKLPPRLQQAASFAAADTPPSPKTVLQGPYYGCAGDGSRWPPPRWFRSGGAFRRTPSAGVGLFSRTWSKPTAAPGSDKSIGGDHGRDAAGPDAPWCSPASSSSSSSVSTCFGGGDDHGRGRPTADGREVSSEEDGGGGSPRGSVRITRFKRNRSLPSVTTSNLWASIRTSVKQITPWS